MIYIVLEEEKREKIEKLYWEWFKKNKFSNLNKIKKIIDGDEYFQELIISSRINGSTDKITYDDIKEFLLSDYEALKGIRKKIKEKDKQDKAIVSDEERKVEDKGEGIDNEKKDITKKIQSMYNTFRKEQAGTIVQEIGIKVCPYCNQNYIRSVQYKQKNKNKKVNFQGDIDHFFPKSEYPYLALCLYNMIPSCKICNTLKRNEEENIEYPYILDGKDKESFIRFTTTFDNTGNLDYIRGNSLNFEIKIEGKSAEIHDVFQLEARYQMLKEEARDIIRKSQAYHARYLEELKACWERAGITEEELKESIFGYSKDHLTKPLSKFNFDIMNEFTEHLDKRGKGSY